MRWRSWIATAALVAALGSAQPARADFLEDAGWGTLTIFTNVLYMPAKLVYATLGGITGGLALGLTGGDMSVAETIWVTSMGGNYVITPPMLRGEESIAIAGTPNAPMTETSPSGDGSDSGADLSRSHGLRESDLGS